MAHLLTTVLPSTTLAVYVGVSAVIFVTVLLLWHPTTFPFRTDSRIPLTIVRLDCSPLDVLCGIHRERVTAQLYKGLASLKEDLHSVLSRTRIDLCPDTEHAGSHGDGGYDVCTEANIRPRKWNCLVYSFGISDNWSFDEDMSKGNFSCEVHSFDPSIGKQDHVHSPNVSFHNVGLWGSDVINSRKWKLEKLSTIRRRLGHEKRTIDVLKVDVEAAEWPFLRNVLYEEPQQLESVVQIILELHTPMRNPRAFDKEAVIEVIDYIETLTRKRGFVTFRSDLAQNCCGAFSPMMPLNVPEKCCYEQHYINSRFV